MAKQIKLNPAAAKQLRTVDPRLMSYNVEMTEVTGGTFWKAYTPEQIAGTEPVPPLVNLADMVKLQEWYDPIDTTNERLINLAKAFGTVWVRVSGTWANKTYYNFDGKYEPGVVPEGFQNVLQKDQWLNLLNFVKAVDGKLLISFANCPGIHDAETPWSPWQAKQIMDLSIEYGVPVNAVEFTNEPNLMNTSGFPKGYTAAHFRRDQEIANAWVRENYPDVLLVGPSSTDSTVIEMGPGAKGGAGIGDAMPDAVTTHDLMAEYKVPMDVFSYHYYNGISERLESVMPAGHWQASQAHTDDYLSRAGLCARSYAPIRDQYIPGAQMWVTESGDAGGGGNTWGSTYLDVLRTLNELGDFATVTDGIIFHNTLASSDYGFLQHGTFEPRPNYWAVLLWQQLMGSTVYDAAAEGHVYCHSRKDGKDGYVYLIVNNDLENAVTVELPGEAEVYALAGRDGMRSSVMTLNGTDLVAGPKGELPELKGERVSGVLTVAPGSCAFLVL